MFVCVYIFWARSVFWFILMCFCKLYSCQWLKKNNYLCKHKSLLKRNLLTRLTTGPRTDLKGPAHSYHELHCKRKKKSDKSLTADEVTYFRMQCCWLCSHDRKYFFSIQCPANSVEFRPQWPKVSEERMFASSCACEQTLGWGGFFSPLAALMASYWWPKVMKRCHLSCSPWRHHCRTTALWVYSKASTHLNKTIRLILSAKAHWVEINLHKVQKPPPTSSIQHPIWLFVCLFF